MAIRSRSAPRRRSGALLADAPAFVALGSGSAANPQFTGMLLASMQQLTAVGAGSFTPDVGGRNYLYDFSFAGEANRTLANESVTTFGGQQFYVYYAGGAVSIVSDVAAPAGKAMRMLFDSAPTSGWDMSVGAYLWANNVPGRKIHVAVYKKFAFSSSAMAAANNIKKELRLDIGGTRVCTLDAFSGGVWAFSAEEQGGQLFTQQSHHATLAPPALAASGQFFWLELMVDFTVRTSMSFQVWINGTSIMSGSESGLAAVPNSVFDNIYLSTVYNQPGGNGSDYIGRIIYDTNVIGVP